KPVPGLAIGAGELPQAAEVVYLARRLNRGEADTPDADAPNVKRIRHPPQDQDPSPPPAAADGRPPHAAHLYGAPPPPPPDVPPLPLVHLDGPPRRLPLTRVRAERNAPRAPGEPQAAHAREH